MRPHPNPLPGREREECWSGFGRLDVPALFTGSKACSKKVQMQGGARGRRTSADGPCSAAGCLGADAPEQHECERRDRAGEEIGLVAMQPLDNHLVDGAEPG